MKFENKLCTDLRNGKLQRLPQTVQGITKQRIKEVLKELDRNDQDQIDAVFALIDNINPNWFSKAAKKGLKFCNGASTAHIACHIGLLQRKKGKLDREGRDYWLKPLWEIGALEKVYFDSDKSEFVQGHPVAKSPNSSYRIAPAFEAILKAPDDQRSVLLEAWAGEDSARARLQVQAELAEATKAQIGTPHEELINAAVEVYVPNFLPGFEVVYIDSGDGDRIKSEQRAKLQRAGINLGLGDSMPDVLLWNPNTDALWVIEAVTSDGEVDLHKVKNLTALAERAGKQSIGFTTAYRTWRDAANRQSQHKNIAPKTHIWILEDGSKQFTVESFESLPQRLGQ